MVELTSFQAIIELWPSKEAMAADVGFTAAAVSKWWQRNSIPADWWSVILATDVAASAGLTAELMTSLAARPLVDDAAPLEVRPC